MQAGLCYKNKQANHFHPKYFRKGDILLNEPCNCGQIIRDNRLICIHMELLANQSMSPATLTAVQAHILQYILRHREHGTSLTAIHRDFGYSMATLSGMLKRLREKGYIRTETCAVDDRCKLLYPTEKGEQVQEFLDGTIHAVEGEIYSCFSPEELATLDCLQKKMLHHLAGLIQQRQKEAIKT